MKIIHLVVDFHPQKRYATLMYSRYLLPKLLTALKDTPVVLLNGARQSGKSTLVQTLPTMAAHKKTITP